MVRLDIGRVVLHVLDDGTLTYPAQRFFAHIPEARWRPQVDADAQGCIEVGHNHALVQAGRELIVVDTGYGDDTHGGRTGHLLEDFDRTGFGRDEVTLVVTTHAHGDHIKRHTGLHDGRRVPTFPRARYLVARADWDWFGGPGRAPEFDEQLVPLQRAGRLELFDGECALAPGVRLLPTPGHTPGHTSVVLESAGRCAVLLGDLCHHPLHFAHPDWVSSFDTHPERTPRTRAALFEWVLQHDALLLCPHARPPGLGRLRRRNGGVQWQPVGP